MRKKHLRQSFLGYLANYHLEDLEEVESSIDDVFKDKKVFLILFSHNTKIAARCCAYFRFH